MAHINYRDIGSASHFAFCCWSPESNMDICLQLFIVIGVGGDDYCALTVTKYARRASVCIFIRISVSCDCWGFVIFLSDLCVYQMWDSSKNIDAIAYW